MSRTYRTIQSATLDDPDFQKLSPPARHVFLTARISLQSGRAAIFRWYPEVLARQTGLALEAVQAAVEELKPGGWIECDGIVLWIRDGLRDDPNMRLADEKHLKAVEKEISNLPRSAVVLNFCDYYGIARPFDAPSEALPSPIDAPSEGLRRGLVPVSVSDPDPEKHDTAKKRDARAREEAPGFSEWFWPLYPKRVARARALRAWNRLRPSEALQAEIRAALERDMKSEGWLKEGGLYVPHPASWINGRRWEDEVQPGGMVDDEETQRRLRILRSLGRLRPDCRYDAGEINRAWEQREKEQGR